MNALELDVVARELDRKILDFITSSNPSQAQFDRLAVEVFNYQYAANAPYRSLCDRLARTPANIRTWSEIPAVSAASFGDARLACFPHERTRLRFISSGTTRTGGNASVHELDNSDLYDASLTNHFRRSVMPDCDAMHMIILSPSFEDAPHSSLAYMLSVIFKRYGSGGGFCIRKGILDSEAIASSILTLQQPALVFGTALAFTHFIEWCETHRARFALPPGSRLVETGGFKGRARTVEREELYDSLSQVFGIPLEWCISEYGMCELTSQWYDANLCDVKNRKLPRFGLKIGPHWTRTTVVDPVRAESLPDGECGLLQVFDLANRGSVAAVLTGDLVREDGEGFVYLGRSPAAPPKGCSITVDSMLSSHG